MTSLNFVFFVSFVFLAILDAILRYKNFFYYKFLVYISSAKIRQKTHITTGFLLFFICANQKVREG